MSTLAKKQQALLAALFDWPNEDAIGNISNFADGSWGRGLKVYQANGHAMACSALRAAYPVVAQLLGDESFDALARALWHEQPPLRGDAAQWGGTLAKFILASDQLASEPYLPDVAALEWTMHRAALAADASADPASFALLTTHDPQQLRLQLSPGCACMASRYPVVSLVSAHLHQSPGLDQVGELLRAGVCEAAVVWRNGWQPLVRQAQPGELAFIAALLCNQCLSVALDNAPELDISSWLPMAVQSGLLLGVCQISSD